MATEQDDERQCSEVEARIDAIKDRLQELAGGKMVAWEADGQPDDVREEFWRRVLEFEERESGSHRRTTE